MLDVLRSCPKTANAIVQGDMVALRKLTLGSPLHEDLPGNVVRVRIAAELDLESFQPDWEIGYAAVEKTSTAESIAGPKSDLEQKSFDNILNIDHGKVSLGNLESELWKKNVITGPRRNKDYLDVTQEDFTKNKTLSIDGREITPSNFNIFRDSLRLNSEQLLRTLQENLPEMNLREIEEEENRRMTEGEDNDDDDEDVVPLDFRTALIEHENKVVI
jgi:hypothetical protein